MRRVLCARLLIAGAALMYAAPVTAQAAMSQTLVRQQPFARWEAAEATSWRPADDPQYRPTRWREGALIGAGVGVLLATIVLTTCDSDSNQDCPGWGRAAASVGIATGLGALIGLFIHKPAPAGT